jgi:integrase
MARKGAAGTGMIRKRKIKRKDGTHYVRFMAWVSAGVDAATGKRLRLEGPWRESEEDAVQDLRELLARVDRGVVGADMLLGDYLDYWLEEAQSSLADKSVTEYRGDIQNHIKPRLGKVKLSKLTPLHLQRLQSGLIRTSSPYVARKVRACLSAALNQALRWQLLDRNPLLAVPAVKLPRRKPKGWEPGEVGRFLEAAKDHRLFYAYLLMLSLGLRLGEARGLKWSDLGPGRVHIQRSLSGDSSVPKFGPLKTPESNRVLPVAADLAAVLEEHRERQTRAREAAGRLWQEHNLIITTRLGTPVSSTRLRGPFERLSEEAEVPRIRIHDLRHTAASLWIASGMDIRTVAARLGHTDATTTLRIYAHAFKQRLEASGKTMAELLEV